MNGRNCDLGIIWYFLLFGWLLVACTVNEKPIPPTPIPPSSYENLPKPGVIECEKDSPLNRMPISLWRHEARIPLDPSDSNPDRGGEVGTVLFCQEIIVLDYARSPYYEEFWFLIETPEGEQGWLSGEGVALQN